MKQTYKQFQLLPKTEMKSAKSFGGILRNTRAGRQGSRPLATKSSMHLVLRSSKAKGTQSMTFGNHRQRIREVFWKFSKKYGVRIHSLANVGNHLHLHLQLTSRYTYKKFICAVTAAVAMLLTKARKGHPQKTGKHERFWDYRPFTRVLNSWTEFLSLKDYIQINKFEGIGIGRVKAVTFVRINRWMLSSQSKLKKPLA
jgi:REP element-mobilizing transposase RayT